MLWQRGGCSRRQEKCGHEYWLISATARVTNQAGACIRGRLRKQLLNLLSYLFSKNSTFLWNRSSTALFFSEAENRSHLTAYNMSCPNFFFFFFMWLILGDFSPVFPWFTKWLLSVVNKMLCMPTWKGNRSNTIVSVNNIHAWAFTLISSHANYPRMCFAAGMAVGVASQRGKMKNISRRANVYCATSQLYGSEGAETDCGY